jgi:hypothetical protein
MLSNPVVPTDAFVFLFGGDHRSPQNCRNLGPGGLEELAFLPLRLPKFPSTIATSTSGASRAHHGGYHTCTRTFTSGLACAERTWRSMMLRDATPWLLLVIAACHAAVLPGNPPSTGNSTRWPKVGGGDGVGPLRKPGYVRMPVSRHHFNGTKRSPGDRHSPPRLHGSETSSEPTTARSLAQRQYQNGRRWGWSALEELGGIAYIMQCVSHCPLAPYY